MPIRLRNRKGSHGRIYAGLQGVSAAWTGAVTAPVPRTGVVAVQLAGVSAQWLGEFQPSSNITGEIVTTLTGVSATWRGGFVPANFPTVWTDTLGDEFEFETGQPFSRTLQATNLGGKPIDFFWDPATVDPSIRLTKQPQVGNTRALVMDSTTGLPPPSGDFQDYFVALSLEDPSVPTPLEDWIARSTGPGVVFAHDFRTEDEINAFIKGGGEETPNQRARDAMRTRRDAEGIPLSGGGSLASRSCGGRLAQAVVVQPVGTVEDWLVDDGSAFPDPVTEGGAYICIIGGTEQTGTSDENGEGVLVTAKRADSIPPRAILTVVRGEQGSPKQFNIGQPLGSDPSDNWHRPLCAIAAPNNGKTEDDYGLSPANPQPSRAAAWVNGPNSHTRVPFAHWGKEKNNYNGGYTDENGNLHPDNPFEGEEFYLQFRVKFPRNRFVLGENGKWFYIDGVQSGIQQIFGNIQGYGDGSLPVGGAWIRSYGDSRAIAGNRFTLPPNNSGTPLPGGDYAATCRYNGPNPPDLGERDPSTCFAFPPDQWITFLIHLRPGHSNFTPGFQGSLASNHQMIARNITTQEDDIVVVGGEAFPDPATWGWQYPMQIRGREINDAQPDPTKREKHVEIVRVLSKSGNVFHVRRNWWRDTADGLNPIIDAANEHVVSYGPNNEGSKNGAHYWLQDPYLCPYYDSYISIFAAYEGEKTYRTVMQSPGLPFIYGNNSTQGNYARPGFNSDTLPGFCFFKPESYLNAYFGSGSQGPPALGHTVKYTQIILSRSPIEPPQHD